MEDLSINPILVECLSLGCTEASLKECPPVCISVTIPPTGKGKVEYLFVFFSLLPFFPYCAFVSTQNSHMTYRTPWLNASTQGLVPVPHVLAIVENSIVLLVQQITAATSRREEQRCMRVARSAHILQLRSIKATEKIIELEAGDNHTIGHVLRSFEQKYLPSPLPLFVSSVTILQVAVKQYRHQLPVILA